MVKIDVPVVDSQKVKRRQLIGSAAQDAVVARSEENKLGPENADLKQMRQFRWMLTPARNSKLDEWIRDAVINAKDKMVNQKKEAIEDIEQKDTNVKSRALVAVTRPAITAPGVDEQNTSPSCSSGGKPATAECIQHVQQAQKRFLEEVESEDESLCESTAVMSFFGTKAM